jgi:opacity protein-like surface antigen
MSGGEENSPCKFSGTQKVSEYAECMRRARVGVLIVAALILASVAASSAQAQLYAGALSGVSTLSGDTSAAIYSASTNFSTYNPQNGLALNGLFGKHFDDFFSVQGDYVWNRNPLNLTGAAVDSGVLADYEEMRHSSQQSLFVSALVYFRRRRSKIRPYLSVGTGWVHLSSSEQKIFLTQGSPVLPPNEFSSDKVALRVPVGIDVTLHAGWRLRYTFSETLSKNPISNELSPPGPHSLKNFQNLIGIVREF